MQKQLLVDYYPTNPFGDIPQKRAELWVTVVDEWTGHEYSTMCILAGTDEYVARYGNQQLQELLKLIENVTGTRPKVVFWDQQAQECTPYKFSIKGE
jgi:hypothetical protein